MRRKAAALLASLAITIAFQSLAWAAEYQWSVPVVPSVAADMKDRPASRAYLWIPPDCRYVRGVVVGQQNMLEERILEHPEFRNTMAELGLAVVWISPSMDHRFQTAKSF